MADVGRLPSELEQIARSGFDPVAALRVISAFDVPRRRSVFIHLAKRATRWRPFEDVFHGNYDEEQAVEQRLGTVLENYPETSDWAVVEIGELLSTLAYQNVDLHAADVAWRWAGELVRTADPSIRSEVEAEIEACMGAAERMSKWGDRRPALTSFFEDLVSDPVAADAVLTAISRQDPWGAALRVALRHIDQEPHALEFAIDVCRRAGRGRARDRWRDDVVAAAGRPQTRRDLESFTQAATRALAMYHPPVGGPLPFSADNELIAAGACSILGQLAAAPGAGRRRSDAISELEGLVLWGGRWAGNRPRSNPVARAAVDGLVSIGDERALAALHHVQQRLGDRAGLAKPLTAAIERLVGRTGKTIAEVTSEMLPTFGLDDHGRRTWATNDGPVELTLLGEAVEVHASGTASTTMDALAEARSVKIAIEKEIARLVAGADCDLRGRRSFTRSEHAALTTGGPIHAAVFRGLIWEVRVDGEWSTLDRRARGGADTSGRTARDAAWEGARLWHPAAAAPVEVEAWRSRIFGERVHQSIRQAFREVYFELHEIPLGGPLRVRRTEAILRSRGWRVTGIGDWDGGQSATATRVDPETGSAADLVIDATAPPNAGSGDGWCLIDPSQVQIPPATPALAVFRSEVLRDLDLVMTAAGVTARDVARSDPAFHGLMESFAEQPLRGTGLLRRDVARRLLEASTLGQTIDVDDRFLVAEHSSLRIHLGTGVMVDRDGEIRPVRSSRATDVPWLPFERDGLLAKILAVALKGSADRPARE